MVANEVAINNIEKLDKLCPVCGYEMDEPPVDFNICLSCGTEFWLHTANATISELREAWLRTGPVWWSETEPQPENWNPILQLKRIADQAKECGEVASTVVVMSSSGNMIT